MITIFGTSEDERVRPTHQNNNGETYSWDNPPFETGNPGDDIQCRCTAEPVVTKKDKVTIKNERGIALAPPTVKRPKGGITGHVWDVADSITMDTGRWAERNEVINAIIAEGGSKVTAATQYQRWRKFNGLVKTKATVKPTTKRAVTKLLPRKNEGFTTGEQVRKLLDSPEDDDLLYDRKKLFDYLFGKEYSDWKDGALPDISDEFTEDNITTIKTALKTWRRMLDKDIVNNMNAPAFKLVAPLETRASANTLKNTVFLKNDSIIRRRIVVHELGHLVEGDPEIFIKGLDFLFEQAGPGNPTLDTLRRITGKNVYKRTEVALTNTGFSKPYMSKVYINNETNYETTRTVKWQGNNVGVNVHGYEIISMGLEHLFRDPFEFKDTNPVLFDFIWDNLIKKSPSLKN